MARKRLEAGNILNYNEKAGFFISRHPSHIGRKYDTARQAYNLVISRPDIRTTIEADKEIFEYIIFERTYGRLSDDNIFSRAKP